MYSAYTLPSEYRIKLAAISMNCTSSSSISTNIQRNQNRLIKLSYEPPRYAWSSSVQICYTRTFIQHTWSVMKLLMNDRLLPARRRLCALFLLSVTNIMFCFVVELQLLPLHCVPGPRQHAPIVLVLELTDFIITYMATSALPQNDYYI